MRHIMARLIKMKSTWGFQIFTANILFVLARSCFESSPCKSHVLAFWILLTVWFSASPVIYAIFRLTIDSIGNFVFIVCHETRDLGCGGEGIGTTSSWTFPTFSPSRGRFVGISCKSIPSFNSIMLPAPSSDILGLNQIMTEEEKSYMCSKEKYS